MGNGKSRNTMMLIAGGYLVYLGYTLISDVVTTEMDNEILFVVFGVLFILAGGYVVFQRGRDLIQLNYEALAEPEESEEDEEVTEEL